MDSVEALHTAARMYGGHVHPVDQELPDADERNDIAVLIGNVVELYTPDSFTSLDQARDALALLATEYIPQLVAMPVPRGMDEDPDAYFWKWGMGGVWRDEWSPDTVDELLTGFVEYVRGISVEELARFPFEPLPYLRTLTEAQTADAFAGLRARWGIDGFYWYPLDREETDEPPPYTVAFAAEPFDGEGDVADLLRGVMAGLGGARVLWLSEPPEPDREIAVEEVEFEYRGEEAIVTDGSFDWLVYTSHESSVTVAGDRLLPALKEAWPSWVDWTSWGEYW